MMRPRIPKEEIGTIFCGICQDEIPISKRLPRVRVSLGQNTIDSFKICENCFEKRLGIPLVRLKFLDLLQKYRKYNSLNKYKCWSKEETEVFIKYMKSRNMEIRDYGIDVCEENKNSEWTEYGLMDLIKKYKINYENLD